SRAEILDALHGTELGTLPAREAEVHVHERDLARPLLLLADVVRHVGDHVLFQPTADDVDGAHGSIMRAQSTSVNPDHGAARLSFQGCRAGFCRPRHGSRRSPNRYTLALPSRDAVSAR